MKMMLLISLILLAGCQETYPTRQYDPNAQARAAQMLMQWGETFNSHMHRPRATHCVPDGAGGMFCR